MDRQDSTFVPRIVVTEPSPVSVPTQSTTASVMRYIEPIPEDSANGSVIVANPARVALEQAVANLEAGNNSSSGEFKQAKDCNECVVSVTEQSSSDGAETTATLEADHDLRIGEEGCCSSCGLLCIDWYEKVWTLLNSGYMLPVWLLLLAVPIAAGIEGAFYIYSCPASHSLALLIFSIGISLMITIVTRCCLIIGRLPVTSTPTHDHGCMRMFHSLLLIASFLTTVFFFTESVSYWKMKPSSVIGAADYCDPKFLTFAFWWNCVMSVLIVPIFLFPA